MERDKRRFKRVKHVFRVDYSTPEALFNEFADDISEGGLFIKTKTPLPIGSEIILEFVLPLLEEPIRVRGRVEWHTELPWVRKRIPGMGVSFQDLSPADKEKINEVVRRLRYGAKSQDPE